MQISSRDLWTFNHDKKGGRVQSGPVRFESKLKRTVGGFTEENRSLGRGYCANLEPVGIKESCEKSSRITVFLDGDDSDGT